MSDQEAGRTSAASPPPSSWEKAGHMIDDEDWPVAWPVGSVNPCSECDAVAFEGRDDLDFEIVYNGVTHVFHDLHGGRCRACGAEALEARDLVRIEQRLGMDPEFVPLQTDYEGKVATFGSGSLGTYWPKDIRRIMHLKPGQRANICVVDKNAVLVRFL